MQSSTLILLIVVAVTAMILGGWISFSDSEDSANITIHKEKIKEDTESAVQEGDEVLEDVTDQGKKLINQKTQRE